MIEYEFTSRRSLASLAITDLLIAGPADEQKAFMLGLNSMQEPDAIPRHLRCKKFGGPSFVKVGDMSPEQEMSFSELIAAAFEEAANGLRVAACKPMKPGSTSFVFPNGDCLVFASKAQAEAFKLGRRAYYDRGNRRQLMTATEAHAALRPGASSLANLDAKTCEI